MAAAQYLAGEELEKALLAYASSADSAPDPAATATSFAKGIGGTKEDHLAEKMAGEIMRGTDSAQPGKDAELSLFELWTQGTSSIVKATCNGKQAPPASEYKDGKWIRTLNAQGTCYLYVHTTTYRMQGTRPDDFVGGEEEQADTDPHAAFPTARLPGLKAAIDKLWGEGKVPLLLCEGDEGHAEVKAALEAAGKAHVLCVKPFVQGVIKTKVKFADHVETARKTEVQAMKAGGTFVIDLSDVGTPHWKDKICNVEEYKTTFPIWMLDPNSHRCVDKHGKVFKKEDKKDVGDKDWDEALEETIKDFRIVYLSAAGPDNYEKELSLDFLPQNKWSALRVKRGADVREINLKSLVEAIDQCVHSSGLVPVLSDPSENTDTFLAFQHTSVVEMKAVILKKASGGVEAAREELRQKLVAAMKQGNTLLLRLTDTAPDLAAMTSDDCFPTDSVFSLRVEETEEENVEAHNTGFGARVGDAGTAGVAGYSQAGVAQAQRTHAVFECTESERVKKVFREEDKESGVCAVRPGFKVVVSTNLPADEVHAKLKDVLPLGRCQVIKVKSS